MRESAGEKKHEEDETSSDKGAVGVGGWHDKRKAAFVM